MRRLIGSVLVGTLLMVACSAVIGGGRAHAAPAKPPLETIVNEVCMTYEDGSGLCGKAHWQSNNELPSPSGYTPGDWVFDTISKRFCVRGNACMADPPNVWGDR